MGHTTKPKGDPEYIEDPMMDDEFNYGIETRRRRPKWMYPQNELQRRILHACRKRKYFPTNIKEKSGKALKGKIIMVQKSMTDNIQGARWPKGWVEHVISWAEGNPGVDLDGFVTYLYNEDAKEAWMAKHGGRLQRDYKASPYS